MVSLYIPRWVLAIVIYATVIGLLVTFKPAIMFDGEGNPKAFASQNTATTSTFAPVVVFPLFALITYFAVSWVELLAMA